MAGPGRSSTRNASLATLVDTNILVYAEDPRDEAKRRQAQIVLTGLIEAERAALSAQCLSEYFNAVTRHLPEPLTRASATVQVRRFVGACDIIDVTPRVVLEACRASAGHQMSIWDALIWAAAKMNGVPYIVTEDAEHGRYLEGVTYLNPFDTRFDLAPLLA